MSETLIIILLIVILIVLYLQKNDLYQKLSTLDAKLRHLQEDIQLLIEKSKGVKIEEPFKDAPPEVVVLPVVKPVETKAPEPVVPPEIKVEEPIEEMWAITDEGMETYEVEPIKSFAEAATSYRAQPVKPARKSFTERHPDLEKYIGENLFNKIGIAILVLGMGFFLKYAIDKNWINEIGRTFIGIITGGALIGIAHRMRKTFAAFSSVLVGGGIAILYFTITIAFQQYHLFSQTLAFIIMILITAFTVLLAINYDRKELAILAILGGFTSPLMISTGAGNYIVLFSYLLLLNIGMLVLAYFKKWNILNVICYAFTIIMFGVWLTKDVINAESGTVVPYFGALIFATLFYFVFFLMNVINNIKERTKFKALEISILLSNTFLYFSVGMLVLKSMDATAFQGLFTALLGVFNMIFAYTLYKNERVDKNLTYLLIGLVLTFCSLVAPIQLQGNHITLFWAAEAVLLLWLSQKSGIKIIQTASEIVLALMIVSLAMDWVQVYTITSDLSWLRPFSNRGFITGIVSIISVWLIGALLRKETDDKIMYLYAIDLKTYMQVISGLLIFLVYIVFRLEVNHQAAWYLNDELYIIVGCFNYLFIILMFLSFVKETAPLWIKAFFIGIGVFNILAFPVFYNKELIALRLSDLQNGFSMLNLTCHLLIVVLFFITLYQVYRAVKQLNVSEYLNAFQWFASILVLFVLSAELDHLVVALYGNPDTWSDLVDNITQKAGYAILWGVFGFVSIYLGMRWKSRNVRIISLCVFAITLLKLFIFDLRGLSEGGKIAAFLSLGVLLLIISFMYQRLKRILLNDDKDAVAAPVPDQPNE